MTVALLLLILAVLVGTVLWLGPVIRKGLVVHVAAPIVTVEAPSPVVVPSPHVTVYPTRRDPGPAITLRLRSGSLQKGLGEVTLPASQRTPTLSYRTTDGCWSQFVASHQDPDGTWVYRRVGVERES